MPRYGRVNARDLRALEDIVGAEYLTARPEELYCYSRDSTIFSARPEAVVRPTTTEQVSAVLRLADRRRIPVTPRGAGTSAAGSPLPVAGGIVLDMSAMNRIASVSLEDQVVVAEAGVVCDILNEELGRHGFFFPPDPASSPACTLGGMVNTNAAGNRTVKYGPTRNYVLWLEVVLPTGRVIHTGSKTLKSASDLDLTRLIVGSEGSLGVVTQVALKIVPLPEHYATAVFIYDSVEALARAAAKVRLAGIVPEMLEFMSLETTRAAFQYAGVKGLPEGNFLLVDCGGSEEAVAATLRRSVALCREEGPAHAEETLDLAYRERLVTARKAAFPALARTAPSILMEDCTVPLSRLPEAAAAVEQIPGRLAVEGVALGNFGHVGDGNMHPTFTFDERVEEHRAAFHRGIDILYREIVLPMGGSLTGEHGIGLVRAPYIGLEHADSVGLMRDLKRLFDPHLILNPGKGKGGPYPLRRR